MAHLWYQNNENGWGVIPLNEDAVSLMATGIDPGSQPVGVDLEDADRYGARLTRVRNQPRETWTLMAGTDARVSVNGELLQLGLRVLNDRDVIQIGSSPIRVFSTERLARIETCEEAGEASLICPRCQQPITAGMDLNP